MSQACKLRYETLRKNGDCVECTDRLPPGWGRVRCPACHGANKTQQAETRELRKQLAARVAALEAEVAELRALVLPLGRAA